uniref:Uncharacterized protein n=1 Tax=viral metagenome TaxID=1070528 RepID=A0A6M3JHC8_9ZZZZ
MAKQTIQQKLKALQKDWKNTEARTGYEDLPNGDYEGVIKNAVLGLTKDENNPKLKATYTLEVTEGDFKGRAQYKHQMVETVDNIAYAKGDLAAIDVDAPDDITDLGETFEQEVVGLTILFSVVHNKEFVNVYFRERLEGAGKESKTEEETEDSGDQNDDTLTADDVRGYLDEDDEGESILTEIIKDNDLDIDPDDYATWSEVADLIIDQLGLE